MRKQNGLSLLELIMSMLMLSIVMVGANSLQDSVVRAEAARIRTNQLQNDFTAAMRQMEIDFGSTDQAVSVNIRTASSYTEPPTNQNLSVQIIDDTGTEIFYVLNLSGKRLTRTVDGVITDLVPPGLIEVGPLRSPVNPNMPLGAWVSEDGKSLTFNLRASLGLNHPTVSQRLPGIMKTFTIMNGSGRFNHPA